MIGVNYIIDAYLSAGYVLFPPQVLYIICDILEAMKNMSKPVESMTDKIQDPFEGFPDVDIEDRIWAIQTNGVDFGTSRRIEGYSKEAINAWRSKHGREIKKNAKIVERLWNMMKTEQARLTMGSKTSGLIMPILTQIYFGESE